MDSENFSIGIKPWDVSNTGIDWIFDRENETSDAETNFKSAHDAWNIQRVGLADRSPLISKTMNEGGVIAKLDDAAGR